MVRLVCSSNDSAVWMDLPMVNLMFVLPAAELVRGSNSSRACMEFCQ